MAAAPLFAAAPPALLPSTPSPSSNFGHSTSTAPPEDDDDALDLFSDALTTIFAEHMPAKGDPLQLFTFEPPPSTGLPPLRCRIPPQQVNALFAHHVWSSGLRMAEALAEKRLVVKGEEVLELGAGAGIPGLMAARVGASRVVLSDYDDAALIANLKSNIPLALPDSPALQARVTAIGHSWGEEESLQALLAANSARPFTRILLADTLWHSEGHALLLTSLPRLLRRTPTARIHICAGLHSGRATVRSFLRKARAVGLVKSGEWVEVGMRGERRLWGWDAPDGEEEEDWEEKEDTSERNKWIVKGEMGWSEEALQAELTESAEGE
ncbi:hypothetical protein JCM10213_000357 [Rhodosporidiobolus nylandii]